MAVEEVEAPVAVVEIVAGGVFGTTLETTAAACTSVLDELETDSETGADSLTAGVTEDAGAGSWE